MSWIVNFFGRLSLATGVALGLAACGGGGGGGDPAPNVVDAVPTGYYQNNGTARVFADDNATPIDITDLQGTIHNGRLLMLSAARGLSYDGVITVSGNTYVGTLTAYRDGTKLTTAPVTGTIAQGASVTGTLSGAGANNGTFTLNYASNNSEAAALSVVGRARNWFGKIGGSTSAFQMFIDAATGNIIDDATVGTGAFRECGMAGVITPISGTHLYSVSVTLSGCHATTVAAEGAYTGLASTPARAPSATEDKLLFSVTNGTYSVSNEFTCDLSLC